MLVYVYGGKIMSKWIVILLAAYSSHLLAEKKFQSVTYKFNLDKPIWEQTDKLYCTSTEMIRCSLKDIKCKKQKSDKIFTVDFINGYVEYFGSNKREKILYKSFNPYVVDGLIPFESNIIKYGEGLVRHLKLNPKPILRSGIAEGIETLTGAFYMNENYIFSCKTEIKSN